jgi:outer membrane receptor protein involved in Fe transport
LRGKNLTDEEDNVSGIAGGGTNLRTPLPPREVMLTLNYKFGS